MKNKLLCSVIFICLFHIPLFGQPYPEVPPEGGGEYQPELTPCISWEDRAGIEARLLANIEMLGLPYHTPVSDRQLVSFDWPLRAAAGLDWNSYYGITNFVDQVAGAGTGDYDCGTRTYDGHTGIDILSFPFAWYLTNNNLVEVIAAEAGTIIDKFDGNADNHCSCTGSWNAIYVQHADGSVTWYGHMKKFSLTAKPIGATVAKGEFLGLVASSGCSTAPHLHFQVYEALPFNFNNLIDPYSGPCNGMNSNSWWAAQKPYRESTLNANLTHSAAPVLGCPASAEAPNFSNIFIPGSTFYTSAYYHDQVTGDVSAYRIRKPDNTIWTSWSHTSPGTYNGSGWYWSWNLPGAGPFGTWTYEVDYKGNTTVHPFTYVSSLPVELTAFTGEKRDNTTSLQWSTASESDFQGFELQHSADNKAWEPLAFIPGEGQAHSYQYTDERPDPGGNYYRLRQINTDGSFTYSTIVYIYMETNTLQVFPNPTSGVVRVESSGDDIGILQLSTMFGSPLFEKEFGAAAQIDLSGYPCGFYRIVVNDGRSVKNFTVVKK